MSAPEEAGGFPLTRPWGHPASGTTAGGDDYARMISALRDFLDKVAGAKPDEATSGELADDLEQWTHRLAGMQVTEREQVFAHRRDLPGRGQTMSPAFIVLDGDDTSVRGTVTFGRYFLGGGGAVHGGGIPLLFDEVLGRLANTGGRKPARTAYLHVNYRSITPVGPELQVSARIVKQEGRKRHLEAELRHGEVLCADAEGLFVELRPGQP